MYAYCGSLIASGLYGRVYNYNDKDGTKYALKKILLTQEPDNPNKVPSFELDDYLRELVIGSIAHELVPSHIINICKYNVTTEGMTFKYIHAYGNLYMERGETPLNLLVTSLSFVRKAEVVRAICETLHVLHQNGIAHNDVKMNNIVFVNDIPKLIDFNISYMSQSSPVFEEGKVLLLCECSAISRKYASSAYKRNTRKDEVYINEHLLGKEARRYITLQHTSTIVKVLQFSGFYGVDRNLPLYLRDIVFFTSNETDKHFTVCKYHDMYACGFLIMDMLLCKNVKNIYDEKNDVVDTKLLVQTIRQAVKKVPQEYAYVRKELTVMLLQTLNITRTGKKYTYNKNEYIGSLPLLINFLSTLLERKYAKN